MNKTQFHAPNLGDEVFQQCDHIGSDDFASNAENASKEVRQQQFQTVGTKRITDLHNTNTSEVSLKNATAKSTEPRNKLLQHTSTASSSTTDANNTQTKITTTELTEPAKPLSSYALFFKETTAAIKQQNPNCTFQELSQIAISLWNTLPQEEKNNYELQHEAAKTEYVKQYNLYQQQKREREQLKKPDVMNNGSIIQTKPAVFTIARSDTTNTTTTNHAQKPTTVNQSSNQGETADPSLQNKPKQEQQTEDNDAVAGDSCSSNSSAPSNALKTTEQSQTNSDNNATAAKCIRENCNKVAIINPDWEDEYCSNECVVIHCRNVFNEWVQSLKEERKAGVEAPVRSETEEATKEPDANPSPA